MRCVLPLANPWGAPVYYIESCASTMEEARALEKGGAPSGTVICAGSQTCGRGRVANRPWKDAAEKNLLFTILLRYDVFADIPNAITLRAGLACADAVRELVPQLSAKIKIKWPNDIMLGNKKVCGILTESDGKNVFTGIGINVLQKEFPEYPNATSITREMTSADAGIKNEELRFSLLEKILSNLHRELATNENDDWRERLCENLFMKNEDIVFIDGEAGSGKNIYGKLCGVSARGALLIARKTAAGYEEAKEFITGELQF
jgi:BirA family biotin operon repressor/biotin-[acetyl-CoA-carboxylase] ligase